MRESFSGVAMDYILDADGPPEPEELVLSRHLPCKGCGTVVKVKRPHGEPMYENGRGDSWPTFYGEPEAPESCKHCPPPPADEDTVH